MNFITNYFRFYHKKNNFVTMDFIKNKLPEQLADLLRQPTKGSRLEIPIPIRDRLPTIQKKYRELYGEKLTRENAILLMVANIIDEFEAELETAIDLVGRVKNPRAKAQ